ncbi:ABC transporter substrate-binding protein [Bradyrhizobium sp. 4]|uniref:ABC transporter substrate-binding protein n=1 Tax=unclassified Bradyrhizobium TaxID=2631580 RepID=UPI001FF81138|nr:MULTISPECIES: ABC transporter substrate-binding protein [unclassified Bradyrhizobium]MCK1397428.1 ABC transporter substrate-binding protein [Bradyrhizobium sp. 39]MCK1752533.1 ABC transporter substrate-binding protein [Bradyrhizobium sp. 135]UPJ36752.1 ABC transporter substrate-binding protein [Bradyrhizobium sp. 4]
MSTLSQLNVTLFLDGGNGARYAGELAALRQGYLPAGVAVLAHPHDPDFVATVASQRAIGVTSGQKFLLAAWRGVPVTAFAASFLDTSVAVFALESSKLKRPSDLIGKRLGYSKGSEGEVVFDAMMAQLGLPRSQIIRVADRNSFEALRARDVDAIVAPIDAQPDPSSPAYDKLTMIQPQDYGIHVPGLVYFASTELVHDHPSRIADVLQGVIRGWWFVYADTARSVPVLAEVDQQRFRPERLKFELQRQRSLVLPTGGRIGEYDESRWRTLRDILLFAKLGEEGVPLSQAVSYQFLREVYHRSPGLANTDGN